MKIKQILTLFVLLSIVISISINACPLTITNDSELNVMLIDHHNDQAIFIKPKSTATIDPTVYGWQKHFRKEKLDIFYQENPKSSQYLHRYHIIENYCTDDPSKNKVSLSDLITMHHKRFTVKEISPKEIRMGHHHENQHHDH